MTLIRNNNIHKELEPKIKKKPNYLDEINEEKISENAIAMYGFSSIEARLQAKKKEEEEKKQKQGMVLRIYQLK